MTVDDLVEAYLAGQQPTVPAELRSEFERAIAGHKAIAEALGVTVVAGNPPGADRGVPSLPEDYEVVRELGRGGMGVVYLARQRSLGRLVAVKVLRPGEIAFGAFVKRFVEEARHLARLRHPNIVSIHETGQAGDEPYFTMDYVEGESLHSLLKRGPLSPTQAVRILKQAAEGVEHAHSQGIIHRDLKPANILLDRAGRAYVTDFGLARDVTKGSELTGSGDILGTPAYMAPEQANGEKDRIGEPTDVHALGVILYEMLTGQAPYGHANPVQVLVRVLQEEPLPARKLNRRVPRDLETVCLKAMAKTPEARYQTVHAMIEDLRRFEGGEPVLARRAGVASRVARWGARHWRPLLSSAAALALGLFAFFHYGPRWFDTKVGQTIAIAEGLHGSGDHFAAVDTYYSAHQLSSDPKEREWCLTHMARCCGELGDSEQAIKAWNALLSLAPDRSFGDLDGRAARVFVADLKRRHLGSLDMAVMQDRQHAEQAWTRLKVFLDGKSGGEEERKIASADFEVLDGLLHPRPRPPVNPVEVYLPNGTPAELRRTADDSSKSLWERGRAALALARALESSGDRDSALIRYRQAYDAQRICFPAWSSPVLSPKAKLDPPVDGLFFEMGWTDQDEQRPLLLAAHEGVRRLDSREPEHLRGGLVFHLDGEQVPKGLVADVSVDLSGSGTTMHQRGLGTMYVASFGPDKTARVGVADGKYDLVVMPSRWESALGISNPLASLYTLDIEKMPAQVEVNGTWIDLPPVRARRVVEVRLIGPLEGASVDLQQAAFRWAPVEGATRYQVDLCAYRDAGGRTTNDFSCWVTTSASLLCLGDLPAGRISGQPEEFVDGRPADWKVEAYDGRHRLVGVSTVSPRFLIERGLRGK